MKAFEFCCPTKIIAGAHALDKLPGELADRGVAHPLVMTDAQLERGLEIYEEAIRASI